MILIAIWTEIGCETTSDARGNATMPQYAAQQQREVAACPEHA
jgi:hypothetical protein